MKAISTKFGFPAKLLISLCLCGVVMGCASTTATGTKKLSKAQQSLHEKALIHTQLARGYMQEKQFAVAKQELERALEIAPSHSESNYVMALLMVELQQYPQARRFFRNAVRSDPQNSPAAHDFGTFLCQLGDREKAVSYFDMAVANPLFSQAKISYARAGQCLAFIDRTRAETYLRKALALDSRLRPALLTLARVQYDSRKYLSARAYIERYLAITKPQAGSLFLAYQIESSLNASDQANSYRKKILNGFPGSKEANELRLESRS